MIPLLKKITWVLMNPLFNKKIFKNDYFYFFEERKKMGWYVECEYCHKSEKGGPPDCDCVEKAEKLALDRMIGNLVSRRSIFLYPYGFLYLEFQIQNGDHEEKRYFSICDVNGDGEYRLQQTVRELTQDQYKNSLREGEYTE